MQKHASSLPMSAKQNNYNLETTPHHYGKQLIEMQKMQEKTCFWNCFCKINLHFFCSLKYYAYLCIRKYNKTVP